MTRLPALLASRGAATAARDARLDLSALLDAVEAAPPGEGVDALAAELAARVSASEVACSSPTSADGPSPAWPADRHRGGACR